jgi:hypothetical protein
MDLISIEPSLIETAILEVYFPLAVLVSTQPLPFIATSVPLLDSSALLAIVLPLPLIGGPSSDHAPLPFSAVSHKLSLVTLTVPVG